MAPFYAYPPTFRGRLLKRYKRFLADIELEDGSVVTAHCPNTGPMTGICEIGAPVLLSVSDNPKRKLAHTWEAIALPGADGSLTWVGTNTALPNRVIKQLLGDRALPELGTYGAVRSEVKYGENSRIDFLLTDTEDGRPVYIEVKNTTWTAGSLALFPDTVTDRGQKHLRELTNLVPQARAVMLYFINRGDCDRFAPGDSADPTYGELLRTAIAAGVEVLACRFAVDPAGLTYLGTVPVLERCP
ncbi:MAG: DNA/RNA nuclease SfsA [Cyanobacteria bacterium]|nr:DNA/RNA nuclease SfsA [Cyanobacteriota bacterium]